MKYKYLLIIFLTSFASELIMAQGFTRYKYEAYIGLGATNQMSDICAPTNSSKLAWVNVFNTIGFMGNMGLGYRFTERNSVSGNLSLGQLHATDPIENPKYWDAGRSMNTFFTEFSARYEFMVVKEKRKRTVYRMLGENPLKNINIPTYLFLGVGGLYNFGSFEQITPDGKSVVSTSYSNGSVIIPFGVGFKYKINNTSYLNLEVGLRFAFTDKMDNWENGWYDQYQSITLNYIKKIKVNKNGMPALRTMFF